MLELLLPESAVESLGRWLADPERGQRYANGTGPHSIPYTPSKWMAVAPWPSTFADRTAADSASVSRAEVVAAVRAAEQSESGRPETTACCPPGRTWSVRPNGC